MSFEILHTKLNELGARLKKDLITELKFQKHRASGKLMDSITMDVEKAVDSIILREEHEFYGDNVDRGRKAGQGAGVKNGKFQLALEKWVRLKGFAPGREKSVAFLIRRKIFREGIPTSGSFKIAPRRLNWLTGTLEQSNALIEQTLEEAVLLGFNVIIDDILARTNAELRKAL